MLVSGEPQLTCDPSCGRRVGRKDLQRVPPDEACSSAPLCLSRSGSGRGRRGHADPRAGLVGSFGLLEWPGRGAREINQAGLALHVAPLTKPPEEGMVVEKEEEEGGDAGRPGALFARR
ncbi:hypothetical protein NQZ68_005275 [Dissostichus eleginoides]|nr:hypothetical protein NQZ68_005275 [Dissostichus eleginoides]